MLTKNSFRMMLTLLFIGMLSLAFTPINTIKASPEQPRVYVDPEHNEFSTTTTSIGDEFNITIAAADWPEPGVMSFEFKLYYDPSMLEPVAEGTGIDPGFWITTYIVVHGMNLNVDPPQPYEDGEGNPFLWFCATLLGAGGNVGGGILAKARFQIIAEPSGGGTLSSDLEIRDIIMVDPSTIPPSPYPEDYYEVIGGTYLLVTPAVPVMVDIDPDTLNLRSKGKWITAYIELPEGYDVNDINVITVMLNDIIPAELHPTGIGDYDSDGIPDLMVKFDRTSIINLLETDEATLLVTGEVNGTPFEGTDTIRVIVK